MILPINQSYLSIQYEETEKVGQIINLSHISRVIVSKLPPCNRADCSYVWLVNYVW